MNEEIPIIKIKKDDGTYIEAMLLEDVKRLVENMQNEEIKLRYIG